MTHWDNVWTFKTRNFKVALDCAPEDSPDLSWDERGEVADKIESGEWSNLMFRVRVLCQGEELGCDYLGNSIYANARDFIDHRQVGAQNREYAARGEAGRCGSYFHDMVKSAADEARKRMAELQTIKIRRAA